MSQSQQHIYTPSRHDGVGDLRCLKDNDRSLLNIPRISGGSRLMIVHAATSVVPLPIEAFRARNDGRLAASACGRVTNKNYATKSKTPFHRDRYVLRKQGGTIETRRNIPDYISAM
jgi:hypothetical protein